MWSRNQTIKDLVKLEKKEKKEKNYEKKENVVPGVAKTSDTPKKTTSNLFIEKNNTENSVEKFKKLIKYINLSLIIGYFIINTILLVVLYFALLTPIQIIQILSLLYSILISLPMFFSLTISDKEIND